MLGVTLLAGSTLLDPRFADFQWDVRPRAAWGAEVAADRGPWGVGVRAWRAGSTQSIDQPGAESAEVAITTLEMMGRRRVGVALGTVVSASLSGGGLWLGYRPDQVTITPAGGSPIVVELAPIHAWTAGAGLEASRSLRGPWTTSLALGYQTFRLDASHREGGGVVTQRKSFGDWSARLGLGWSSWRP
jgi:hypothetical protein